MTVKQWIKISNRIISARNTLLLFSALSSLCFITFSFCLYTTLGNKSNTKDRDWIEPDSEVRYVMKAHMLCAMAWAEHLLYILDGVKMLSTTDWFSVIFAQVWVSWKKRGSGQSLVWTPQGLFFNKNDEFVINIYKHTKKISVGKILKHCMDCSTFSWAIF